MNVGFLSPLLTNLWEFVEFQEWPNLSRNSCPGEYLYSRDLTLLQLQCGKSLSSPESQMRRLSLVLRSLCMTQYRSNPRVMLGKREGFQLMSSLVNTRARTYWQFQDTNQHGGHRDAQGKDSNHDYYQLQSYHCYRMNVLCKYTEAEILLCCVIIADEVFGR